jgi:hypothetical protein
MTAGLYDQDSRQRLLGMRFLLAWVGLAVGAFFFLLLPDVVTPWLFPVILCLGLPECATGWWLWHNDPRPARGRALFFAYAAWGLLRWFGVAVIAVIVGIIVGGILFESFVKDLLPRFGNEALGWLLARLLIGSLISPPLALVIGLVCQGVATSTARLARVRLYVAVSVVYAWMRQEYPPPVAVDFVRQTRPRGAFVAFVAAMIGFVGWCTAVYWVLRLLQVNGLDFLHQTWGAAVAVALVPLTFVVPYMIGAAVQSWLSRGYRQPTPRDCWAELYTAPELDPARTPPIQASTPAQESTSIQPASQDVQETP